MKEVQMTFRVDSELRNQFMNVAEQNHLPAAQLLRGFMRKYVTYVQRQALNEVETCRRRNAANFAQANVGLEGFKISADEE